MTLESLRKERDDLLASDALDKDTALSILKLLHAMEELYQNTVRDKDHEIERLSNELANSELKHEHSALSARCQRFEVQCRDLEMRLSSMQPAKKR